MQIVPQSTPSSKLLASTSVPLLPAPPKCPQLCAPSIAGLLPAQASSSRHNITVQQAPTVTDLRQQLGRLRSREEMDAEIAAMAVDAMQFLQALRMELTLRGQKVS